MAVGSSRRSRGLLLALVVTASACSNGTNLGFGVAMTLHFDQTVTNSALSQITRLAFVSDEPFDSSLAVGRPLGRVERLVYRPLSQLHSISIKIAALDASGIALATGVADVPSLAPDKTTEVDVAMTAPELSDAGMPDGGPIDLSGADLTSACSGVTGTIICEDFENGLQSFWEALDGTDPNIAIDTSRAHTGTHALHIQIPATATLPQGGLGGTIENENTFHLASATDASDAWVTVHYFLTSAVENGSFFFLFQQWDTPFDYITVGAADGHPQLSTNLVQGTLTSATTTLPTNVWTCVTLHVVLAQAGAAHFLVDTADVTDVTLNTNFALNPTFGRLRIGYRIDVPATSTPAVDLWLDDIRIDTTPFSCAN
jgi:hypothetical protein